MSTELSFTTSVSRSLHRALQGLGLAPSPCVAARRDLPDPSAAKLPRWRGFNLVEKCNGRNEPFRERDFAWIAELGFDFVRLPMDYRGWIKNGDWTRFHEPALKQVDDAVRLGEKYGVHVQLNLHRAPGHTVAQPPEVRSVWTDEEALRVSAMHWAMFAKRYHGISNARVSFNPFNEPVDVDADTHRKVIGAIVTSIREHDGNRLIVCDGRDYARIPPEELLGLKVAAATRGYEPFDVTHYRASWVNGADEWAEPTENAWDRDTMRERLIMPWKILEAQGMGVMVGEFGAHNRTPHNIVLAWLHDLLALWQDAGWGWAMWNFRGSFGVLDSGRADVKYDDWRGHKLDPAMLEVLQSFKS